MANIFESIYQDVKQYTMVSPENIESTISLVVESIENNIPGDLVECGSWRGGSSFAMLLVQRQLFGKIIKPVWLFDSFQGLPPADERDGPAAARYQAEVDAPGYYDNCTASLTHVQNAIIEFGFSSAEAIVVPGWFQDTIPQNIATLADCKIAVLRVDCDWYDPVYHVLDSLVTYVQPGGKVILDDYYVWDGCARATHDFLSKHSHVYRIKSMPQIAGAWFDKNE